MSNGRQQTPRVWEPLEPLGEAEEAAWSFMDRAFHFRPGVHARHWPGIGEPVPSITYDIGHAYGMGAEWFASMESDLCGKALAAFQVCTAPDRRLYSLDWQHPCYWLHPHRAFSADDPSAWRVPLFPNGDYYIFLAEDFSFGLFGHPWEQTICVFGRPLLDCFKAAKPLLFTRPIRENGLPV